MRRVESVDFFSYIGADNMPTGIRLNYDDKNNSNSNKSKGSDPYESNGYFPYAICAVLNKMYEAYFDRTAYGYGWVHHNW